ncbi:MAG: PilN domain-containing protein [Thermodesulfovibrionales bacterium]
MPAISRMSALTADFALKFSALAVPVRRVLLFSPADDLVYSQTNVTAAIDKGSVSAAYGSKVLSLITLKGVREYVFDASRYPQPEELASSVAMAMSELGASRPDITLTIPKAWAIVKTVEFPSTVKENLSEVMMYEMDRITPFAAGEAYYDFKIIRENGGRLSILVIAARADAVMPYIIALNEKGIRVSRLMVDLQAMLLFSNRLSSRRDSLFLKVDHSGYEGAVRSGGAMSTVFSGSFSGDDDGAHADLIASELKSASGSSRTEPLDAVVLLKERSPSFKELLKAYLPMPVRFLGEIDIRLRFSGPHKDIPYPAVAGLYQSLQPDQLQFNLLRKGIMVRQKTPFVLTILLLLGILTVAALYVVAPLKVEKRRLQDIASQISARKDEVKKVEALQKDTDALQLEIETISGFRKPEPITLNIIKEITTILPKTAWVTRVKITETTVDIEGYATSANELLPKLEASPYLRKVEFSSPTFRDAKMNADRFVIRMEIEGAKKTEPTPPALPTPPIPPIPPKGEPARK